MVTTSEGDQTKDAPQPSSSPTSASLGKVVLLVRKLHCGLGLFSCSQEEASAIQGVQAHLPSVNSTQNAKQKAIEVHIKTSIRTMS